MRKIEPTIIVLRRDMEKLLWVRDHYFINGYPDEDAGTYDGTISTGFDSGEEPLYMEAVTADIFPNDIIIISPPEKGHHPPWRHVPYDDPISDRYDEPISDRGGKPLKAATKKGVSPDKILADIENIIQGK